MKRTILSLAFVALLVCGVDAQEKEKTIPHAVPMFTRGRAHRTEIILPQVNGYNVYKGDFHIHTVYSDGVVTPSTRVNEAWLDGLDIIAITDHYDYQKGVKNFFNITAPYNEDGKPTPYLSPRKVGSVKVDFNAIHDEAVAQLEKNTYPMLLIKGVEMTRGAQTYGHYNCLFLNDANTVYDRDLKTALGKVREQGGFIIHNHPGWKRKTADKNEQHEELYNAGLIDGVEVVNGHTFYPPIVRRCLDEKLTMFANTDIHGVSNYHRISTDTFRTMTFVLAKDLTEKSIKEALLKRRTLAYVGDNVIGEEKLLADFLNASIDCRLVSENKKDGSRLYRITNLSSITYTLGKGKTKYILMPFKTQLISIGKNAKTGKPGTLMFSVKNMWHLDYKNLDIELELDK